MVRPGLTLLLGFCVLLATEFSCRHGEELQPIPVIKRSTNQIARITEWSFYNSHPPGPDLADVSQWLLLIDNFRTADYTWSSQYQYDHQGRLTGHTFDGSINRGEGPVLDVIHQIDTFEYGTNTLIIKSVSRSSMSSQVRTNTQTIPTTEPGLVVYSPQLGYLDIIRAPDAGKSALLKQANNPLGPQDTLRQYDPNGYLRQISFIVDYPVLGPDIGDRTVSTMQLTVNNGDISQTDVHWTQTPHNVVFKPTTGTKQSKYTYDKSRAGLRSPYQFMGTTNLHLIQSETVHSSDSWLTDYSRQYRYSYDSKGRVIGYTVGFKQPGTTESMEKVGKIVYTDS